MEESHYSWDCEKAPCGIPAVGFFYAFHMPFGFGLTFFLSKADTISLSIMGISPVLQILSIVSLICLIGCTVKSLGS